MHPCPHQVCQHRVMTPGEFLQYGRPPVRNTALRVYIEPIENFDVNLALTLNSKWGSEYPVLRQGLLNSRPPQIPSVPPPFTNGEWWAMSSIEQTDQSLQRVLAFQFDQISLSWSFDDDKPEGQYPGFEKLSRELDEKVHEFAAVIEEIDSSFEVHGCECIYTNILEDVRGPDWIGGYLTAWNDTPRIEKMPTAATYLGVNFRFESSDDEADTFSVVSLKDDRESQEAELKIRVLATPPSGNRDSTPSANKSLYLMQAAHRELISQFEDCASPAMKEKWERVER
jgi:uncharacterized protein (TIGR04255 family)